MVYYTVVITGTKDNLIGPERKFYDFESEIVNAKQPSKELIAEIVEKYKDEFKDCDFITVRSITTTPAALNSDFGKNIPEQYKELYEKSIKAWEDAKQEVESQLIEIYYEQALNSIKKLRISAASLNLLDSQAYLNFLDELNKLSIDQDRPDNKKPNTN